MRISDYMTGDHRHCDELFVQAEQAAAEESEDLARLFGDFRAALERHFGLEENLLFPRLQSAQPGAAGPIQVMCNEHTQMRALLAEMEQAAGGADLARFLDLAETLLVLMQQHNLKEEQILYPLSDQALDEDRDPLLAQLKAR